MSDQPIRIWLSADHHAAFRCGGFAYVLEAGGSVSGAAGGERNVTAARTELLGLSAALAGLPPGPVTLHMASPRLLRSGALIAGTATGEDAPAEDLDLWARVVAAAKGRAVRLVRAEEGPKTPSAFAAAWAELARDKAKASGGFVSAIPKTNLSKVQGL